jgi:hypothetical protein
MRETGRTEIAVRARTLAWVGGELYDVAAGWRRFALDGSESVRRYSGYSDGFDAVTVSPAGDVIALLCGTGTKGLLLDPGGRVVREINRSHYCAEAYRYPLALFTLPGGRTGVVHCPESYNRLEVEDAVTGERLTASTRRAPEDIFHSRLAVAANGRWLISAGWVWHPFDWLAVYDLTEAMASPERLDGLGDAGQDAMARAEIAGACFVGDDIVLATGHESGEPDGPGGLGSDMLARWSTAEQRFVWQHRLDLTAGDLIPMAGGVLALHDHPRLYDARTGDLACEWPDLLTGKAVSSIVGDNAFSGPARVAVDDPGRRFVVTDGQKITVVAWQDDDADRPPAHSTLRRPDENGCAGP